MGDVVLLSAMLLGLRLFFSLGWGVAFELDLGNNGVHFFCHGNERRI